MGKKMKIDVFLTDLVDVLKLLNNKKLYEKSFLSVSRDNLISIRSYNGVDYLNGDHCVTENMFLRWMENIVQLKLYVSLYLLGW